MMFRNPFLWRKRGKKKGGGEPFKKFVTVHACMHDDNDDDDAYESDDKDAKK